MYVTYTTSNIRVLFRKKVFKVIDVKIIVQDFKGFDDVGFQTIMWI